MKYVIMIILSLLTLSAHAADSAKVYTKEKDSLLWRSGIIDADVSPGINVRSIKIAGRGMKSDSVPVNCHNIIGPFPMTSHKGWPMYRGVLVKSKPLRGGSAPLGRIRLQATPTNSIKDTITGNWKVVDTVAIVTTNLGNSGYIAFDSTCIGNYVWFDLHNYDTAAVYFNSTAVFIGSESYK